MAKATKAAKAAPAKAAKAPAKAAPAKAAAAKAAPAKGGPLSRGDVIEAVAAQTGLSKVQSDAAMKAYEATISKALAGGGEVRLAGFASFKTSQRAARVGRNPQTGAAVKVAARTVPRFVPSLALKTSTAGKAKAKKK